MKKAKIIVSIVFLLATIILLILSLSIDNQNFENAFKVSATVSLAITLSFSLTLNVNKVENSFNTMNFYDNRNKDVDKAWRISFEISVKSNALIIVINQPRFEGDKERIINDSITEILKLASDGKELLCVYDGVKNITIETKNRIEFANRYFDTAKVLQDFVPVHMINSIHSDEILQKLIALLKLLVNKYDLNKDKMEEI